MEHFFILIVVDLLAWLMDSFDCIHVAATSARYLWQEISFWPYGTHTKLWRCKLSSWCLMFLLFNRRILRHRITQLSDSSSSTKRWTISGSVRYFSVVQRCSRDCIIHDISLGPLSDGRISPSGIGAVFGNGKTTGLFYLARSQQVQSVSSFGRANAHLPLCEEVSRSIAVEARRAIISVESAALVARRFMHGLLVVAQRLHIGVFWILETIFMREAAIIVMDIRVTASSICVVMHGFRRASNACTCPL